MSTTLDLPADVAAYLAVVRNALADLPADERDDLLSEVEDSVLEAAGDSTAPIATKLGPPEAFAAELRTAAGLHEAPPASAPQVSLITELRDWAANNPRARAIRTVAGQLAPIWWAARGYLAVGLIAIIVGASWSTTNHAVPRLGNGAVGLLAILVAVGISIWLGLRTQGRKTRFAALLTVLNVALLVAAIPIVSKVRDNSEQATLIRMAYASQPQFLPPEGLAYYGTPIQNVYPYSREGKLLHDVLLFDSAGNPLELRGADDPNRRVIANKNGAALFNAFPVRYYEPGTTRVAHPNAGPQIVHAGEPARAQTIPAITTQSR